MASKRSLTVAIAGTGGIAGHIVDYLVAEKKHHVVVLTRKEQPDLSQRGVDVRVVDYENIESLKSALKDVHTVISGLGVVSAESSRNLIHAAEASGVKRFVPSEWAADVKAYPLMLPLYAFKLEPRELLEKSKLEYTLVCDGLFMDYLLPKGAKKYFKDVGIPISVPDKKAVIPGNGEALVTLTTGDDIGHAIGELLHVADGAWEKYTYIVGETTTWNKITHAAEQITGTKFAVTYRSEQEINKALKEAAGDMMKQFFAGIDMVYAQGVLALPHRSPAVDTFHYTTTEEFMKAYYGKA